MNTKHFLHRRSEPILTGTDHHMSGSHDLHAGTKKALERWENEGGRIPGSGFANDNDRSPSRGNG